MKRFILPMMICTSLVAAQFTVTRQKEGDNFVWSGSTVDCNDFTDTHWYSSDGCECNGDLTFSTEINGCKSYENEGYYRFGSNSATAVRCVNVSCHDNDMCIFTSPEDGTKLQVSTKINPMKSSVKCEVNFVEMIHDCMPRNVSLTLKFIPDEGDDRLYLQLQSATPLSYLEGELFKADMTCNNERGDGKLFFKYNGTRNLLKKGSFDNIPAYNPSATSCTDVPTLTNIFVTSAHTVSETSTHTASETSTHTASETSTNIMSWTVTPIHTTTSHVQPTSNGRSDNGRDRTIGIAAGVGAAVTILIVILVVIIYIMLRRKSKGGYVEIDDQDSLRKPTTQGNHPPTYGSEDAEMS